MTSPVTPPPDDKDWTFVLTDGCSQCGFSPQFDVATTGQRIRATLPRWRAALQREDVRERPEPEVWSALEYGAHVRDVYRLFARRLGLMLATDGATFDNWDQDQTALAERYWTQDPVVVTSELEAAGAALADDFDAVPSGSWGNRGFRSNGSEFTVATFAAYLLHDVEHHLADVGA